MPPPTKEPDIDDAAVALSCCPVDTGVASSAAATINVSSLLHCITHAQFKLQSKYIQTAIQFSYTLAAKKTKKAIKWQFWIPQQEVRYSFHQDSVFLLEDGVLLCPPGLSAVAHTIAHCSLDLLHSSDPFASAC